MIAGSKVLTLGKAEPVTEITTAKQYAEIAPTMSRILHTRTRGRNPMFEGIIRYLDIRGTVHTLRFRDSQELDRFLEKAKKAYRRYLDGLEAKQGINEF
jgi:hypothetical protein